VRQIVKDIINAMPIGVVDATPDGAWVERVKAFEHIASART